MSFFNASEAEQAEAIQLWVKTKLPAFLLLIFICFGLLQSYEWYRHKQETKTAQASMYFYQLMQMKPDSKGYLSLQQQLDSQYPDTIYAQLSHLMMVKKAVSKQAWGKAEYQLKSLIHKPKVPNIIKDMLRVRLARVLIQTKQSHQAIVTLDSINNPQLQDLRHYYKAQAYLQLNDEQAAINHFRQVSPQTTLIGKQAQYSLNQLRKTPVIQSLNHPL